MAGVGSACLAIALLTACYAVVASVRGARTGRREWVTSGRRAMYCLAGLCVTAFAILESAFLRSDFSFGIVAEGSSTDTPTFYKVTAVWATQQGSLLLWATLLGLFSSAVLFLTRRTLREIAPWATAVLGVTAAFFLFLMLGWENPFDTLASPPAEGAGLNPLLRHPAMMIHPPMLYTGYVALLGPVRVRGRRADHAPHGRRLDPRDAPLRAVAWTFLGTGIMLGALWSYTELGWGGYWAWDPVENASLMPWLLGTAFLHSIMVQEKRGMLKIWNASLICATFVFALLGTFLVRSGILDSIHAFGASTIGVQMLVFIGCVIALSAGLIIARLPDLRSEARLDSLLSREAFFLLNNLVLVGLCLVIMWGTFFPLISEALTGTEASVGPPWFDRLTTPLALVLVLLTGIGPVLAWRRVTLSALRRILAVPVGADRRGAGRPARADERLGQRAVAAHVLLRGLRARRGGAGVLARRRRSPRDDGRELAARADAADRPQPPPLRRLPRARRHRGAVPRRGRLVGVHPAARRAPLAGRERQGGRLPGDLQRATARLGGDSSGTGAPIQLGAVMKVRRGGDTYTLHPSRNYYSTADPSKGAISRFFEGEATSEVDVRWGLKRDFWLAVRPDLVSLQKAMARADRRFADSPGQVQALVIRALTEVYRKDPPPAAFRAIVSPLVTWIWIGGAIAVFGALLAAWPSPEARLRRVRSLYASRLGRELSRV